MLYTCVCICVCRRSGPYVLLRRPEIDINDECLSHHSPLSFWDSLSLVDLEFTNSLNWLARKPPPPPRYSPRSAPFTLSPGVTGPGTRLGYCMGVVDPNSGPYSYTTIFPGPIFLLDCLPCFQNSYNHNFKNPLCNKIKILFWINNLH